MIKKILVLILLVNTYWLVASAQAQETVTITTYYPSPYGSYRELRSQRMAIGKDWYSGANVCWEDDPVCTASAKIPADLGDPDTDLVVQGNVGIGTTNPLRGLHVHSPTTQSRITISGYSDSGATYSALYLDDEDTTTPGYNFWVMGYRKDIGLGTEKSLVFGRTKEDGTHFIPMMINKDGNVGIGTVTPQHSSSWGVSGWGVTSSGRSLDVAGEIHTRVLIFVDDAGNWHRDNWIGVANNIPYAMGKKWLHIGGVRDTDGVRRTAYWSDVHYFDGLIKYYSSIGKWPDYVFEPGYKLESIEEHANFMWENKRLPAIKRPEETKDGKFIVELSDDRRGILEELEKAHIYIAQLKDILDKQEERIASLENKKR